MKKKNLQSGKIYLRLAVSLLVILSALAYFFFASPNGLSAGPAVVLFLLLALSGVVFYHALKDLQNLSAGLPAEDERSKRILLVATGRAFTLSIWWLLALAWLVDWSGRAWLLPRHVAEMGVLGMAVLFALSWVWTAWRGDID